MLCQVPRYVVEGSILYVMSDIHYCHHSIEVYIFAQYFRACELIYPGCALFFAFFDIIHPPFRACMATATNRTLLGR